MLLVNEIGNGFADGRIADVGPRKQTDQSPGGLRSRAGPLALGGWRFVAGQRLTEAAVGLLNGAKPHDRALAVIARGQRNRFQGAQNAAGSVNVVDAPPAEPGAVIGLIFRRNFTAR